MNMYEMLGNKHNGQRKKFILLGSLMSLLIVLIVTISVSTVHPKSSVHISTVSKATATTTAPFPCKDTLYPKACESQILSAKDASSTPITLDDVLNLSIKSVIDRATLAKSLAQNVSLMNQRENPNSFTALDDCVELLDHSIDQLNSILDSKTTTPSPDDTQTWLSTAITHQTTCLDGLQTHKFFKEKELIHATLQSNIQHVSNSLVIHKSIVSVKTLKVSTAGRRLLSDDFPTWVSTGERKLLESSIKDIEVNAVVAMDGTGTHRTISEALAFASLVGGGGRTVIHVTAGTYNENNIMVSAKQSNVMLVGDGKGITIITGSKSAGGGSTTRRSASFGAGGDGFIARDISFVNTAGPSKGQAVALVVTADKSVFYRCSIIGYQDTLYTLSNRQFYRETDIYGTVDFIFGNSAVVFQSCNILPRSRGSDGKVFITAQGRTDPNQNTGISIHKCRIAGTGGNTYLGRPWKKYSRTVYMQSFLDGINPAGWFPWNGMSTIYYGEYMNSGPGASTSGRVKWSGNHPSMTPAEASEFTVGSLISGNSWLPSTGIIFESGLGA